MSILVKLKEIVVDQLRMNPEEVKDDSDLVRDLGADSLDIVEITMAIDERFGVDIPDDVLPDLKTVNDFAKQIEKQKN